MLVFWVLGIVFLVSMVLGFLFWKDIDMFFNPDMYIQVEIETREGSIKLIPIKKAKDLSFKFREGVYFMYFPGKVSRNTEGKLIPPKFDAKPRYMLGKHGYFRYKEGYSYPIVENVLIESESEYNQQLLEQRYEELTFNRGKFDDDIMKWVIIIGVVVLVIAILYALVFKQNPVQVIRNV